MVLSAVCVQVGIATQHCVVVILDEVRGDVVAGLGLGDGVEVVKVVVSRVLDVDWRILALPLLFFLRQSVEDVESGVALDQERVGR